MILNLGANGFRAEIVVSDPKVYIHREEGNGNRIKTMKNEENRRFSTSDFLEKTFCNREAQRFCAMPLFLFGCV